MQTEDIKYVSKTYALFLAKEKEIVKQLNMLLSNTVKNSGGKVGWNPVASLKVND